MSKSRVKIKVVVIAESEGDSAEEDDTDLLSTQEDGDDDETTNGKPGKNFEADESCPVAVETSFRDDRGTILKKQSEVDLLAHCIFCLRKTVPCGNAVAVSPEKGEHEMLQVVSRAHLPSSLSSFLNSFNRFLSDLQQVNGNEVRSSSSRRGDENTSGIEFLDLPKMCEFCAEKMETVHRLYLKLNTEIEVLGNIIAESNNKGKYSWRAHQFESALSCSNLERDVVDATADLLNKLDKTCRILMSDPDPGVEDKCTTATTSVFQGPATTFQSLNTSATHETEPNSPSNELSSHSDAGESDDGEEFLINDEGEDDNRADADYIKSEPEETSSDNDSTSEEETTRPRRRTLRSTLKCQRSLSSDSHKSSEIKLGSKKPRKRPVPHINSWSGRITDRLAERQKMEENKTFSTSVDPATGKEIFKCELGGCGATFKFWGSLFNHQGPNHNPNNVCASCGKSFRTSDQLHTHNKRVQCDKWKQTCDLCKKEICLAEIYEHVRAHVGDEYLIKCPNPECRHVFSCAASLREHARSRTKSSTSTKFRSCNKYIPNFTEYFESYNSCQVCGLKATKSNSLRIHLFRVHENPNQKKFPCPIKGCPHQFTLRQSVECHLFEHEMIPDVQNCSQCGSTFNFEQMDEHLKEIHGAEEVFKCIHCPFLFSTRESMLDHMSKHKNNSLHSCDICGESLRFPSYSRLRGHYFSKHGVGREYPCAECGHISWTQDRATSHSKKKHDEDANNEIPRPVKLDKLCDVCNGAFATAVKLRDHKIQAHGAEPYRCILCNATFFSSEVFWKHEREHGMGQRAEGERGFRCNAEGCGKIFTGKMSLQVHFSCAHQRQKHVCEVCGKSFDCALYLQRHVDSFHLRIRPFVCEVCGSSFASKGPLITHKTIHSEDRPYGCQLCNKKFKNKSNLCKHVKTHCKKERLPRGRRRAAQPSMFRCDAQGCGKVYKRRYLLRDHVSSVHLGERKHVCELCGKSFSFASTLWTHKSTVHLQIRKFICETCGERFSSNKLLRRHNRIHTGERPFSCDICGQRFRQKEALSVHLASHRSKGADFKPTGPMQHIRKRVERKFNKTT